MKTKKTKKKTTGRRAYIAKSPNGLKVVSVYKEINPDYADTGNYIVRSDGVVAFATDTLGIRSAFHKEEVESGKSKGANPGWTTKKLSRREAIKVIKRMSDWDRV